MTEFSSFEYRYRNASNYKSSGSARLEAYATEAKIKALRSRLSHGEFVIAELMTRFKAVEHGDEQLSPLRDS